MIGAELTAAHNSVVAGAKVLNRTLTGDGVFWSGGGGGIKS